MKSYLSLIPISAKVRRRQNRMTHLCIIFAVFLVTAIFTMADMFVQSETANAKESGGNWHIRIDGLTAEQVAAIAQRSDVAAASWFDSVNLDRDRDYTISGVTTVLGGVEDAFRTDIMTYFPEEAGLEDGEVILTPNARKFLGVAVGDSITLETPAGHYPLQVSGFRSDSTRYATDSGTGETTALLVTGEQVGAFVNFASYRQILNDNQDTGSPTYYIQFNDKANIRKALEEIKTQYGVAEEDIHEHLILMAAMGVSKNPMATQLYPVVVFFFLLVLTAGVLMIAGSLNSAIAQRTQFFGMMRCIGMSRRQVIWFVRLEALNWCKTAVPAGAALGTVAAWILCAFLRYFVGGEFSRMVVIGISIPGIVSGAAVGVLTVLIAAQSPAKKAAKISPVAAVSGNADSKKHKYRRANTSLMRIETALGVSHASSSGKNLLMMAGSFALSIILFLCFSVLVELLGCMMPTKSYSPDLSVSVDENEDLISHELVQTIREMPGVKYAFGRSYASAVPAQFSRQVDRDWADVLSYDNLQLDWLPKDGDLKKGGDLEKVYGDQGYVLCIWDQNMPLTVGDTITLNGITVEIAGMIASNPFSNNGQTGGDVILICSEETYARLTGSDGLRIVDIQMTPDATDKDVEALHDLVRGSCDFRDRREEGDSNTFYAFALFIYGFLVVIALITILNIVNSISMSVSARTKQYGAMRAVGMDGGQLTKMIAAEASTYAATGCIAGCGIGLPLSRLLYDRLITSHFPYSTWTFPVSSVFVILLFVLAATFAAVRAPSRRIRNMAVTETINEL